ncbi:MAG: recombinase family protein [Planctomycetota bacterium]|jgi:DNA invertase Pin-like site-specific DNA recombinase
MTDCVIYVRVSTRNQPEGMGAQRAACLEWASSHGYDSAPIFYDVASGGLALPKRPGLYKALSALPRGGVLLVAKRDRLSRDVFTMATIEALVERRKARVVSVAGEGTEADDPAHRLLRRMVDAFAEYERLIIGQRTRDVLAAKRDRGEMVGEIPYGFSLALDRVGLEIGYLEEQDVIDHVIGWHSQGHTQVSIAARLNERGFRTRRRRLWTQGLVHQLLRSLEATEEARKEACESSNPRSASPRPAGGEEE